MVWFANFKSGFFFLLGAFGCCAAIAGIFVATLLVIKFIYTLEHKHKKK